VPAHHFTSWRICSASESRAIGEATTTTTPIAKTISRWAKLLTLLLEVSPPGPVSTCDAPPTDPARCTKTNHGMVVVDGRLAGSGMRWVPRASPLISSRKLDILEKSADPLWCGEWNR